ncbi:response regulator [uncultured Tateyamaria sp.]|uniref:response regulator n=1 Tax=uncultured Tateyamaria sp. TaxID=455651 RepID=UPI0026151C49|nr:response regulator [uncultured Tateyamaria sp.]
MRALILEDDFDLVAAWRACLDEVGIETVHVHSALEGWALLGQDAFDIVVADIFIRSEEGHPTIDGGILLLGKIRAQIPRANRPKTIAVSGFMPSKFSGVDPLVTVKNMDVDSIMRKPFFPEDLRAEVQRLLQ